MTIIFTIAIETETKEMTFSTNMQEHHGQIVLDAMHVAQKAVIEATLRVHSQKIQSVETETKASA